MSIIEPRRSKRLFEKYGGTLVKKEKSPLKRTKTSNQSTEQKSTEQKLKYKLEKAKTTIKQLKLELAKNEQEIFNKLVKPIEEKYKKHKQRLLTQIRNLKQDLQFYNDKETNRKYTKQKKYKKNIKKNSDYIWVGGRNTGITKPGTLDRCHVHGVRYRNKGISMESDCTSSCSFYSSNPISKWSNGLP